MKSQKGKVEKNKNDYAIENAIEDHKAR